MYTTSDNLLLKMNGNGNSTNNMSTQATEWQSLEDYSAWIKFVFEIVSFICIIYSIVTLLALRRTKTTPETARFLSSALISYDILAVFCFNIRKFIDNHASSIMVQVFGVSFCNLAFVTIGIMSLERLIIFYSPYFYLRYVNVSLFKKATFTFWIIYYISYWLMRIVVCATVYPPFSYYNVIGVCNNITFYYYGVAIGFVLVMWLLCYSKIFMIIRKEHLQVQTTGNVNTSLKILRNYKSTSLVFVYSMTSIASAVMYSIIIAQKPGPIAMRLWNDAVNTWCCMMDPLVYVLWYKECRLEIFKLFSNWFPSLEPRVEQMRRDIFYIP